jgi:outer membrane biosynthesis protein TonB
LLRAREPTVEASSGKKALDNAAIAAIRASAPFEHLPNSFKGPNIELRF